MSVNSTNLSRRHLMALLGATALGGCVSTSVPNAAPEVAASFDGAAPPRAGVAGHWWQSFQDRRLEALINAGLARNLDVQSAVAAIRAAEADADAVGGASLPQLAGTANAGRGRGETGLVGSSTGGTFTASWAVDLFGGQRAARTEAAAIRDAAWASAEVARLTVAAAIATAYVDLRFQQESIALTRRSVSSRRETLALTRERMNLGDGNQLEVLQAEQAVAQAEAALPDLEVGFDQALNRLATLLDQRTADLRADLQRGAAQPRARFRASVGLPAEVIRARPDVREAELNLLAAAARIGVAEAALYPSVSLAGNIGVVNPSGSGSQRTWSFGPQINLPIFTGGANRARLRGAEARAEQAHLGWRAAVLKAVEEVENALASYNRDSRNIAAQARLVSTTEDMLSIARETYQAGQSDFLTVLDAERGIFDARLALAGAVHKAALSHVRLNVAAAAQ